MKKVFALTVISVLFTMILASCGSSKGSCDAYGSTNTVGNSDLAAK